MPLEQKRHPSTWQERREGQGGWKGQVKWHLHCQFLLGILSPSPLPEGGISWSSKQIKRSKCQLPWHAEVQCFFLSSCFCWTMYHICWLDSWSTEFTFSPTFPPVWYVNNGSQALPTLVPFFSRLFIFASGSKVKWNVRLITGTPKTEDKGAFWKHFWAYVHTH